MDKTLDILPGEGEQRIKKYIRVREECEICGEPAHYKHSFLLNGTRINPASSAYGKDDCTWCQDDCYFVCKEHLNRKEPPDGMTWCSTFPASERFKHMFLKWEEI